MVLVRYNQVSIMHCHEITNILKGGALKAKNRQIRKKEGSMLSWTGLMFI
jgi:hypothetical protein